MKYFERIYVDKDNTIIFNDGKRVKKTDLSNCKSFENLPIEGLKIKSVSSTYSTNERWYKIFDPRGFTGSVCSDNLVKIMMEGTISEGTILGKYVWTFENGYPRIVNPEDKEFRALVDPVALPDVNVGDKVQSGWVNGIYCGSYFVISYTPEVVPSNRYYYNSKGTPEKIVYEKTPCKIIKNEYGSGYDSVKSFGKDYKILSTGHDVLNVPSDGLALKKGYSYMMVLFNSRNEMKAFDTTKLKDMYKNL